MAQRGSVGRRRHGSQERLPRFRCVGRWPLCHHICTGAKIHGHVQAHKTIRVLGRRFLLNEGACGQPGGRPLAWLTFTAPPCPPSLRSLALDLRVPLLLLPPERDVTLRPSRLFSTSCPISPCSSRPSLGSAFCSALVDVTYLSLLMLRIL